MLEICFGLLGNVTIKPFVPYAYFSSVQFWFYGLEFLPLIAENTTEDFTVQNIFIATPSYEEMLIFAQINLYKIVLKLSSSVCPSRALVLSTN